MEIRQTVQLIRRGARVRTLLREAESFIDAAKLLPALPPMGEAAVEIALCDIDLWVARAIDPATPMKERVCAAMGACISARIAYALRSKNYGMIDRLFTEIQVVNTGRPLAGGRAES